MIGIILISMCIDKDIDVVNYNLNNINKIIGLTSAV